MGEIQLQVPLAALQILITILVRIDLQRKFLLPQGQTFVQIILLCMEKLVTLYEMVHL